MLRHLPSLSNRNVLVGHATSDDAAVYRLNSRTAVVETVDFFTPMVDDPYAFGQIAAANALSDIWAMGAKPLFALNVVGFPAQELPLKVLSQILKGGADKAHEAGVPILGGHSIDDPEPKYGMAVTGLVHPKRILTNAGARAGDALILTKPLGSGIISTAIKRGKASPVVTQRALNTMSRLNRDAGEVFAQRRFGVHALTDVTGFGLLGHLLEMCRGAGVGARLVASCVPFLEGTAELAARDIIPGGTRANLKWVEPHVHFPKGTPDVLRLLLADAQTNGGLLAAVPKARTRSVMKALERAGCLAPAVIGEFVKGTPRLQIEL